MRKFVHLLCGVAVGLLAAPVMAQESEADSGSDSGLYFSVAGVGSDGSFMGTHWTGAAVDATGLLERTWFIDYHYGGLVALGYQWAGEDSPAGTRLEIEGGYRRSEIQTFIDQTGTIFAADGYLETGSVMANGYVDFHLGQSILPYLGVGIGAARLARRDLNLAGIPVTNKFAYTTAFQLMAGVGYKLSPGTVLGIEFRRMELQDFSFPGEIFSEEIYFQEFLITFRLVG